MVIYWSIKSAIDLAAYGLGQSDTFQGTGVFSSIKMSRDKDESEKETTSKATTTASAETEKDLTKKQAK